MTSTGKAGTHKIIFVTGTDTGVGKTLLAGLVLFHLRRTGRRSLAMKPFCSGGMGDVNFFSTLQDGELRAEEICPFFFAEPVAPLVAARMHHRKIRLAEVLDRISKVAQRCDCLIVEGSGGLFVPLGEGYTVADLIHRLNCVVVVVAPNRLGTLNHTLLTVNELKRMAVSKLQVVVMNGAGSDLSSHSNERILRQMLAPIRLFSLPFLGADAARAGELEKNYKKIKKTLALMTKAGNL
jgi:dethiobiotin synthetase